MIDPMSTIFSRLQVKLMIVNHNKNGSCIYSITLNIMVIDNPMMQESKTSAHINDIDLNVFGIS